VAESPARAIALEALLDRQGLVTAHLDRLLSERSPAPADAALACELAHGVVRRRRTLDAIIRVYSDRPKRKPPAPVQEILRLGVYQLVFLDRIPAFAAVSEAVDACRSRHRRRAGFVNAVLRSVDRDMGDPQTGKPPLDQQTVPIAPDRYRVFGKPMFYSPEDRPEGFLGEAVSLPDDLAGRWLGQAHSMREAYDRAMQVNARPPVVARVNTAQMSVAEAIARLTDAGVDAAAHVNGVSVVFTAHVDVTALDLFAEGVISPQDPTATAVVGALDVRPGMRVLDLCAAPGTKTMQIGQIMGGAGQIVAVDVSEAKLQRIAESARRCGLDNIELCPAERLGSLDPESFDRILIDAPCSNTGVLARRVEARWRFRADALGQLAADQRQLIAMASVFLAAEGRMVYSTCSIEPEENDEVIQGVVRQRGTLKVADRKLTRAEGFAGPAEYRDGGFWAALTRS
jgi:16S rRNA (cytosine967-C5)-methyltransferase